MNNFIKNIGKTRESSSATTTATVDDSDELALVKSAAWAWYEHGSGSDGRPAREFDAASRTKTEPKPTRYKLEALRNINNAQRVSKLSRGSNNNSLLDHYEVERISRQLDYYMESSGRAKYRGPFSDGSSEPPAASVEMKSVNKVVVGRKKKIGSSSSGLRLLPVVCGSSRDDVVENRRLVFARPEKGHVAVVEVGSCRPRTWGGVRA